MNAYLLKKSEVQYELRIRGQSDAGTANELRKRLTQCFSNNLQVDEAVVNGLDAEAELGECEEKLGDLSTLVQEFGRNPSTNEGQRLQARLWHLHQRLNRIPVGASSDSNLEKQIGELSSTVERLLDGLKLSGEEGRPTAVPGAISAVQNVDEDSHKPKQNPSDVVVQKTLDALPLDYPLTTQVPMAANNLMGLSDRTEHLNRAVLPSTMHNPISKKDVVPRDLYRHTQSVPVYKWGIKFDRSPGQSIGGFLLRVEELRRARGVSHEELFNSAVDLFDGPALVWYRSTINRIHSWESLCEEMKITFQPPDHDFRLQQEIFNRTQGDSEPIDMYIASMEGLYERLAMRVSETSCLQQMLHNLNPHLQDRLAMFDVNTIEELRISGRKAEMGRFRSSVSGRNVSSNIELLEPDLAYRDPHRRRTHQVASIEDNPRKCTSAKCWNCGAVGHVFKGCSLERKKFCFGCGKPGVSKPQCMKCSPKNV